MDLCKFMIEQEQRNDNLRRARKLQEINVGYNRLRPEMTLHIQINQKLIVYENLNSFTSTKPEFAAVNFFLKLCTIFEKL